MQGSCLTAAYHSHLLSDSTSAHWDDDIPFRIRESTPPLPDPAAAAPAAIARPLVRHVGAGIAALMGLAAGKKERRCGGWPTPRRRG